MEEALDLRVIRREEKPTNFDWSPLNFGGGMQYWPILTDKNLENFYKHSMNACLFTEISSPLSTLLVSESQNHKQTAESSQVSAQTSAIVLDDGQNFFAAKNSFFSKLISGNEAQKRWMSPAEVLQLYRMLATSSSVGLENNLLPRKDSSNGKIPWENMR